MVHITVEETVEEMNLDDILTHAEEAPVESVTVPVCIDPKAARERSVLLEMLAQARQADVESDADQRLSAPAPETDEREKAAQAELDKFDEANPAALLKITFSRMEGQKWALLTSANPIRHDVPLDAVYGYDYDSVSNAAARATGSIDGEPITDAQWDRLYKRMSGHDVRQIVDAVWTLNEYQPQQFVEALVKGSGAA